MKLSDLLKMQPHLDMDVELQEGTVVTDALLLLRDVDPGERTDALGLWTTDSTTGIVQYGMVCAAKLDLEQMMTS